MRFTYIYTGTLDLTNQSGFDLLDILVTADELILDKLINYVQKYIIKRETDWLVANLIDVLHTVFDLQSCNRIQDYIMNSICTDPNLLFGLDVFPTIEEDIFLRIIKRDDLNLKEIDIWNRLVDWGTLKLAASHEKSVEIDIMNCDDDFISFKKILDPFLSYIRFYELSSEEFYNCKPQYSILLPRHGNVYIDSAIIGRKHSVIISSWIEKKSEKLSCKFLLSYRGTRDKFSLSTVYSKCENIVASLVLIKIKDSPSSWKVVHRKRTCLEQVQWASTKNSRVENRNKAIYNRSNLDEFWFNFGGGDLTLNGKSGTCSKCNYEKEILDNNFFIPEEIEIFEVQGPTG
ncbi:18794_t:CDS:2 [Dentiscutata erythropus]|uniref:18794_t:CDS:1 n=1 Tax=Dentiscutata erythropus TaxID=1348616 RepID=A0A9N9DZI1_9GLOM|nr:18794_t:CDS:2 [Dentiscutata erythropus]